MTEQLVITAIDHLDVFRDGGNAGIHCLPVIVDFRGRVGAQPAHLVNDEETRRFQQPSPRVKALFKADNIDGEYVDLNSASWNWPGMLGGGYHPASTTMISAVVEPRNHGQALGFHLVGGSFSLESVPTQGTTLRAEIPLRGTL